MRSMAIVALFVLAASLAASPVSAQDVREVVRIWTPKKEPEFAKLAVDLGQAYKAAVDEGVKPQEAVEAVAQGIQAVAK